MYILTGSNRRWHLRIAKWPLSLLHKRVHDAFFARFWCQQSGIATRSLVAMTPAYLVGSRFFLLLTLLFVSRCQGFSIHPSRWSRSFDIKFISSSGDSRNSRRNLNDLATEPHDEKLVAPNREDMHHLAYLLANMTDHLDTAPEVALTIASQEMGWLFSKDVPK